MEGIRSAHRFGDSIHAAMESPDLVDRLIINLEKTGLKEVSIERIDPTIEDCFMALMSEENDG
jgi:hypothetical protein